MNKAKLLLKVDNFIQNNKVPELIRDSVSKGFSEYIDNFERNNDEEYGDDRIIETIEKMMLPGISIFKTLIKQGHSPLFAVKAYDVFCIEDNETTAKNEAYDFIRSRNKKMSSRRQNKLVYREAFTEAKSLGKTEIYCSIYSQCIVDGDFEDQAKKFAEKYDSAYSFCINKNKSQIFSQIYAWEIASDYSNEYSTFKAEIYEQEIISRRGKRYADYFSTTFATEYINAVAKSDDNMDKKYYRIKSRIKAYVHFKGKDKEYAVYEQFYLNFYFSDECKDKDFMIHRFIERKIKKQLKDRKQKVSQKT